MALYSQQMHLSRQPGSTTVNDSFVVAACHCSQRVSRWAQPCRQLRHWREQPRGGCQAVEPRWCCSRWHGTSCIVRSNTNAVVPDGDGPCGKQQLGYSDRSGSSWHSHLACSSFAALTKAFGSPHNKLTAHRPVYPLQWRCGLDRRPWG